MISALPSFTVARAGMRTPAARASSPGQDRVEAGEGRPVDLRQAVRTLVAENGRYLRCLWEVEGDRVTHLSPALAPDGGVYVLNVHQQIHVDRQGASGVVFPGAGRPQPGPDVMLVRDHDRFHACDPASGKPRWSVEVGARGGDGCAFGGDGTVFVGGEQAVLAVDAAGHPSWKHAGRPGLVFSVLGRVGGTLLATSQDHVKTDARRLHGLDPATGEERWSVLAEEARLSPDGRLFARRSAPSHLTSLWPFEVSPRLAELDPASGENLWELPVGQGKFCWAAAPGGTVVISREDGRVEAFRGRKRVWEQKFETCYDLTPGLCGDTLLLSSRQGQVRALNVGDGASQWHDLEVGEMLVPPVLAPDGTLYAKSARDGRVRALVSQERWRSRLRLEPNRQGVEVGEDFAVVGGVRVPVRGGAESLPGQEGAGATP